VKTNFVIVATLAAIMSAASISAGELRRVAKPVAGSYVVVMKRDAPRTPEIIAAEMAQAHGVSLGHIYSTALNGFSFRGSDAAARAIARDPRVDYFEEDALVIPTFTQSPTPSWGLDRIDQRYLPLNNSYTSSYTGAGTVIYVIDSGVNPVADLAGRIRQSRNFVPDQFGNVNPNNTADCANHGTLVASLAAGATHGPARQATVVNLRVLDCANEFNMASTVSAAVNWMVSDHINLHPTEPAVANMSLSTFQGTSSVIDNAVMNAIAAGITVVVSASNGATDACTVSPAHLGNSNQYPTATGASTITVGGSEVNDAMLSYSNYGPCVDIFAPGLDVMAMNKNGDIVPFEGTSAAAPHVAGVAAIHMQRYATANNPGMIQGVIKDNGTVGVLTGLPSTSTPNLLLSNSVAKRRACCS
jgi:subtilisin family serine protease